MHFSVARAYGPSGSEIPGFIMEAIVQAIALEQPEGLNTGVPMSLPMNLKRIWTGYGAVGGETWQAMGKTSGAAYNGSY
jgi:hypothetical protein